MAQQRVALALLLTALGLALAAVVTWVGHRTPSRPAVSISGGESVATVAAEDPAVALLRRWDTRRADAYAAGDVAALRRLYVSGSRAGEADVRLLQGYRRRGLRIVGMRMQLLAVEGVQQSPHRLRVRVTDRLADAVAVGRGQRVRLPTDRASTHLVILARVGDRWQMATVSG